jgi:hypothetical protein
MMVDRTVTPRDTIIEVDKAQGVQLVEKGHAVEIETPQAVVVKAEAAKTKVSKPTEVKDKAD